ncbi:MAG: helix-turn-helix domain-containing protein [Methanosarcinales archaeon]|nr:helix-turn-helix domain-containing protein [Methanosarcinales archaeon]
MKLNRRKICYIINHKKKGESCEIIAEDIKISKRRVEQIWKEYHETGEEPLVRKNLGRPKKAVIPEEVEIIKEAFNRFKFGARMLEPIIEGLYNIHIPHNRIHMYLLSESLAGGEFYLNLRK